MLCGMHSYRYSLCVRLPSEERSWRFRGTYCSTERVRTRARLAEDGRRGLPCAIAETSRAARPCLFARAQEIRRHWTRNSGREQRTVAQRAPLSSTLSNSGSRLNDVPSRFASYVLLCSPHGRLHELMAVLRSRPVSVVIIAPAMSTRCSRYASQYLTHTAASILSSPFVPCIAFR